MEKEKIINWKAAQKHKLFMIGLFIGGFFMVVGLCVFLVAIFGSGEQCY